MKNSEFLQKVKEEQETHKRLIEAVRNAPWITKYAIFGEIINSVSKEELELLYWEIEVILEEE